MRPWYLIPLLVCSPWDEAPTPPNVVLIVTDDQGWGDFGFQGNTAILTPHLDALAARSAQLESFYVSPVCAGAD